VASAAAAAFRVLLTPLDAVKVVLQADGAAGFRRLRASVREAGPRVLFRGAGAMAANTLAAHYAFFVTFNELSVLVAPLPAGAGPMARLARNAGIGFAASVASDVVANSLRVVKTVRMATGHSYADSVRAVVAADGVRGLLTRGLRTRIAANAAQGLLYGAVWRTLDDEWVRRHGDGHSGGDGGRHGGQGGGHGRSAADP